MSGTIYRIEDFNLSSLEKACEIGETLWSPAEVQFLGAYGPDEVQAINNALEAQFPKRDLDPTEWAKDRLTYTINTMDNAVWMGIMSPRIALGKRQQLQKIYERLKRDFNTGEEITEQNLWKSLSDVKNQALDLMDSLDRNFSSHALVNPYKDPRVPTAFFTQLLGSNLDRIMLYGSCAEGEGSDLDLMLFVREINAEVYETLYKKSRTVDTDKPVGIVLMPSSKLEAYAACDQYSLQMARVGKLVFGEALNFPLIAEEKAIQRAMIKAGRELVRLRTSLDATTLKFVEDNPQNLEFMLKLEIWIRKALLQKEKGVYLSKKDFLAQEPVPIIKNPASVKTALLETNYRVKQRVETFLTHSNR